jgi:hypothetical protein
MHAVMKRDARTGNNTFLIPQGKADLIISTNMGTQLPASILGYKTLFFTSQPLNATAHDGILTEFIYKSSSLVQQHS